MSGTRVTAEDIETGESETQEITNDYILVVDGTCTLANVEIMPDGTTVLFIKKAP